MAQSDFAYLQACQREGGFIIVGRAGMDLYPLPDKAKISEATQFRSDVGGSAGNIAVALAKAGKKVRLLSSLSQDAVGDFVKTHLDAYGVDTGLVGRTKGVERTSLALAESVATDTQVVIYRNQASDLYLDEALMAAIDFTTVPALVVTGTALSLPSAEAQLLALAKQAKLAGCPVIIDIDYRPTAWQNPALAKAAFAAFIALCDVVVANDDEFGVVAGGDHEKGYLYAKSLCHEGKIILYKKGAEGCEILAKNSHFTIPIFPVDMVKPFGAGDAFLGNLLAKLAEGVVIEEAVLVGAAAAALVVSRVGCASAMPDAQTLNAFMASHKPS